MASVPEEKKALRGRMIEALGRLDAADRARRSESLTRQLRSQPAFADARQIFCYVSMPEEVDTHPLIRTWLAEGKRVAVPRVVPGGANRIEARLIERWDGSFRPGPFGISEPDPETTRILEPNAVDAVVVPGLAFDADGYRLGRGKGYYDRFLAQADQGRAGRRTARIALAFDFQRVERVPREPHDQRVDLVLYS